MIHILPEALNLAKASTQKSGSPGVLIFNGLRQLLFMNGDAQELCKHLRQRCNGKVLNPGIPGEVVELCDELAKYLQDRQLPKDWEEVQVRRLVTASRSSILLRGYGFPYPSDPHAGCFLILMEEVKKEKGGPTSAGKAVMSLLEHYGITDREQMILVHLLEGRTNKEIAVALNVSENTIKDHIKKLMQKTKTCTRTGLLARVILTVSEQRIHGKD